MKGSLDILNVGSGHVSLQFDTEDSDEAKRAKKIIADMLQRGYAVFVDVDGELRPVRRFDPEHGLYIIADVPPGPKRARKSEPTRSVPMTQAKATGVGRTAGG